MLPRFSDLLRCCDTIFRFHDLQSLSQVWESEPSVLPIRLRCYGIYLGHGSESLRDCLEVDFERQQPIQECFDIRLHHCYDCVYYDSDELLQQSA